MKKRIFFWILLLAIVGVIAKIFFGVNEKSGFFWKKMKPGIYFQQNGTMHLVEENPKNVKSYLPQKIAQEKLETLLQASQIDGANSEEKNKFLSVCRGELAQYIFPLTGIEYVPLATKGNLIFSNSANGNLTLDLAFSFSENIQAENNFKKDSYHFEIFYDREKEKCLLTKAVVERSLLSEDVCAQAKDLAAKHPGTKQYTQGDLECHGWSFWDNVKNVQVDKIDEIEKMFGKNDQGLGLVVKFYDDKKASASPKAEKLDSFVHIAVDLLNSNVSLQIGEADDPSAEKNVSE